MISNVNIETGQGLATDPAPFKPGERIAVEYMPIAKIENNVAVLAKAKPKLSGACGAKTETTVMMPFFVRGGFKVELSKAYKIPRHYVCVRYTCISNRVLKVVPDNVVANTHRSGLHL